MTECSEGLYRRNDIEDCRGIKLWYEWKICNNEESQVKLARGKSKFVKGGNNLRQKPKGKLAAGKCSVASRVVPVNTCDFDGEELGKITMPKSIILQSTAILTTFLIWCASQLSAL